MVGWPHCVSPLRTGLISFHLEWVGTKIECLRYSSMSHSTAVALLPIVTRTPARIPRALYVFRRLVGIACASINQPCNTEGPRTRLAARLEHLGNLAGANRAASFPDGKLEALLRMHIIRHHGDKMGGGGGGERGKGGGRYGEVGGGR